MSCWLFLFDDQPDREAIWNLANSLVLLKFTITETHATILHTCLHQHACVHHIFENVKSDGMVIEMKQFVFQVNVYI